MSVAGGVIGPALVLFDYSRGRQALMSVAQPALGAVLAAGGLPSGRTVSLGLLAATTGFLCVFAANDLFDRHADRDEIDAMSRTGSAGRTDPLARGLPSAYDVDVISVRHPLAAGVLPLWLGVSWVVGLALVSLAAAWALRPLCALLFLGCIALEFGYCALKRRSWLKTLPAGVMVGLGGLAGWFAVGGSLQGAVLFFLLLTVWEIAGRNLSNDLADASSDGRLGITTVATVFGPRASARWILAGALAMPLLALLQPGDVLVRALLAVAAIALMTIPAVRLHARATEAAALSYFNHASLYPVTAFGGAALLTLA